MRTTLSPRKNYPSGVKIPFTAGIRQTAASTRNLIPKSLIPGSISAITPAASMACWRSDTKAHKHTNTNAESQRWFKRRERVDELAVREEERSFTTTYPYRTLLSHIVRDGGVTRVTLPSSRVRRSRSIQSDPLRLEKKKGTRSGYASISLRSTDRLGSASLRFLARFFSSPDRRRASRE